MKAKIIVTLYIKNVTGALYTVNYNKNTLSVSVNAAWNSVVLTARRNDCSEVAALTLHATFKISMTRQLY